MDLNDLLRDLILPKDIDELLGFTLNQWISLSADIRRIACEVCAKVSVALCSYLHGGERDANFSTGIINGDESK